MLKTIYKIITSKKYNSCFLILFALIATAIECYFSPPTADETQIMKYKLVTLPRGTSKLPILDLGFSAITLKQGASIAITPQTLNFQGATTTFEAAGYTATIADIRVLNSYTGVGINTEEAETLNTTTTIGTNVSKGVIGTTINLTATTINTLFGSRTQLQTTLTVVGRDSGARLTIPVTITKTN